MQAFKKGGVNWLEIYRNLDEVFYEAGTKVYSLT